MANEITSIFDYIFPRKKASDYQQTNLLDYAESPESQNVYNPGQGDFGVMSLEGLKNSIPASLAGTLDTGIQLGQYLRQGKEPVRQINENVEPEDFNIYNQYQSTETRPFTKAFQDAGIINTDEEIKAFRERSMGYDTGNLLGQITGQGLAFKTLTGNAFRDWINFAVPFANIDPISEPNMAQIAQELGADNDFINYMAGNVDENSDAEAILAQKIKNIGSESLLNIPIDGAVALIRSMKSSLPQFKQYIQDSEYRGLVNQDIKEKATDAFIDTMERIGSDDLIPGIRSLFGQTDNSFGIGINNQNLPWSLSSTGEGDFYIKRHGANAGTPSKERTSPNDIAVKVDQNVLLPDYAYYLFQYLQPKMAGRAHGSVQQAINFRDVNDTLIEHLTGRTKTPGTKLFLGESAPGADQDMLALAKQMYKEGNLNDRNVNENFQKRAEVWEKTGWAQDRIGKWYFEISDKDAVINSSAFDDITVSPEAENFTPVGEVTLSKLMEHPTLYKNYPEFADFKVQIVPGEVRDFNISIKGVKAHASADLFEKTIQIPKTVDGKIPSPDVLKDSIIHEVQHQIQMRERFMNGGDTSIGFASLLRDQLRDEMTSKAQNPGAFRYFSDVGSALDYRHELRIADEIYSLARADMPQEALAKLKASKWWAKEGGAYEKRLKDNGTPLREISDSAVKTEMLEIAGILKYKAEKDLDALYGKYGKSTIDQEIDMAWQNSGRDPEKMRKSFDDEALKAFGENENASYFKDKWQMIRDVEEGVYAGEVTRKDIYYRLFGESQARLAGKRINYSADRRTNVFPEFDQEFGADKYKDGYWQSNQPILVEDPEGFYNRQLKERKTKTQGVLQLAEEPKPRELAPVDEGGYFMKSAQVVMDDPREVYKQPGLLAQVNKKGEVTGELLNKGVTKDEIQETGLLNYLNKKQEAGESVTKQELLDFIQENRPEIDSYVSFRSGNSSGASTPNVVIDTPNHYGYDPNTGTFITNDYEMSNFKLIKHDDESVFLDQDEAFLENLITYPEGYGSRARDRRPSVIMRVVDNMEGFTPEQKAQISNSFLTNSDPSSFNVLRQVAGEARVPSDDLIDSFTKAVQKTAKQNYYKDPQFEWKIPIQNDNGVIANYQIRGAFGSQDLDQSPHFYLSVERDGNISDLGEVESLAEARVQIQDSIRSYNYDGDTAGIYSDTGVNWDDYVQGNTDLDSYREVAVIMPKYLGSDMRFHSMAGLESGETDSMLGHLRIDNRTDLQGRKHTHSMEHQSDLSQKAREYGVTQEDFERKLKNAQDAHYKVKDNRKKAKEILRRGKQKAHTAEILQMPQEIVGSKITTKIHQVKKLGALSGMEITQPMLDQYINRMKKFVIDNGFDDEVTGYKTTPTRNDTLRGIGTEGFVKKKLNKDEYIQDAIDLVYSPYEDLKMSKPTIEQVRQRFIDGNPTIVDLEIADKTGDFIRDTFRYLVNDGKAPQSKYYIKSDILGQEEPLKLNADSEVSMYDLNNFIQTNLLEAQKKQRENIIQKYAESQGVKGDFTKFRTELADAERTTWGKYKKLDRRGKGIGGEQPPLINKDRHTKVLLKELIKQGIKDGSDVVSWTPSINQIELWGKGTTSMMRKLYDKDSLKFGNEILKELGLDQKVQTKGATIDYGTMKSYSGDLIEQGQRDVMYIELTPELKKAVMNEAPDASEFKPTHEARYDKAFRQPLYAVPPIGLIGMPNEDNGRIDTNKGLLQ